MSSAPTPGAGRAPDAARPVPSGRVVRGAVVLPPSKSVSHRYLNLALLAGERARVGRVLEAEDTGLFLAGLSEMGWGVSKSAAGDGAWDVELEPPGSSGWSKEPEVFCGNAGTFFRFLVATASVLPTEKMRIDGTPRLCERPIGALTSTLGALGARVAFDDRDGYAPLFVEGATLAGGAATLDASESSQYLSAILMAGLRAPRAIDLEVEALASAPYIGITLQAIERFGGRGAVTHNDATDRYRIEPVGALGAADPVVEGDWSAAGYPAAAALLTGGEVTLHGLRRDSAQGDRRILELLAAAGARVEWQEDVCHVGAGPLRPLGEVDLGDVPDQVPTVAAVAAFLPGTTRIVGVPHLRIKESDRLAAMAKELARGGASIEELPAGLVITGDPQFGDENRGQEKSTVVCDSWDDHRIAMAMALVGLRRGGVSVAHPEVVGKSYPHFWDHLDELTGGRSV